MLKCKHCKGTEFGVTLTEVKTTPVKMKDGEAVGMLAEPVIEQSYEVNFCFSCNTNITEADLIENETCPVCGIEVPELVDGACPDCTAQKKKLLSMTKEELILMMMKGGFQPTATEQKKNNVVETKSKEEPKAKEPKEEVKEEPKAKKAATKKKESEPKDVIEEEVAVATEEVVKSVENAEQPSSADNSKVAEIAQVKPSDTDLDLPPVTEDDILSQLDSIDVDGLGLSDDITAGLDLPF